MTILLLTWSSQWSLQMAKANRKVKRVSEAGVAPPVMSASAFKARCLELMDLVAEGRGGIVTTQPGAPVGQRGLVQRGAPRSVRCLKGTGTSHCCPGAPAGVPLKGHGAH